MGIEEARAAGLVTNREGLDRELLRVSSGGVPMRALLVHAYVAARDAQARARAIEAGAIDVAAGDAAAAIATVAGFTGDECADMNRRAGL